MSDPGRASDNEEDANPSSTLSGSSSSNDTVNDQKEEGNPPLVLALVEPTEDDEQFEYDAYHHL